MNYKKLFNLSILAYSQLRYEREDTQNKTDVRNTFCHMFRQIYSLYGYKALTADLTPNK